MNDPTYENYPTRLAMDQRTLVFDRATYHVHISRVRVYLSPGASPCPGNGCPGLLMLSSDERANHKAGKAAAAIRARMEEVA